MPRITKRSLAALSQDLDTTQDVMSNIGGESEEDLTQLDPAIVAKTVVFATDWTTDTLISQLRKANISLDPSFQRRDAWTVQRKSKFIESIMLGLPIPQLVLAESADKKGTFIVIDGKQRLLSLQQFAGINLEEGVDPLKLNGLEMLEKLNSVTHEDLSSDARFREYFNAFEISRFELLLLGIGKKRTFCIWYFTEGGELRGATGNRRAKALATARLR